MDMTSVYAPITKMAPQDDGSLLVHGKATGSDLDLDQQRCDPGWLSRAVPEWFKIGNIREMHDGHRAVGKATEHEHRDDDHYITAKIVDPVAVAKAKAGVYTGFSIGVKSPRISKSADAPNGVITDGRIVEISIVDAPCLPTATLTLVKSATPGMELNAADFDEERGLVRCEELVEKTAAVEDSADAGLTASLADRLPPEQVEKLAAAADPADIPAEPTQAADEMPVEKAADTEAVDVPAEPQEAPSFDVGAAKALVDSMLAKAEGDDTVMDLAPVEAPSDEVVASVAISLIAGLIQSEAQGMVDNPDEDCDIKCLLNAVAALRWFIRRERQESGAGGQGDASPYAYLAATPDEKPADTKIVVKDDAVSPEMVAAVAKAAGKAVGKPEVRNEGGDLLDPNHELPVKTRSDNAPTVEKTTDPDTVKATVVEDTGSPDGDALVKALSAALSKNDNPLRQQFEAIVKASTETTAEAVTALTARLVKVESMAVPGGPALRRTEVERVSARANDLAVEVAKFKALAAHASDIDLQRGYAAKAAALETELKAL